MHGGSPLHCVLIDEAQFLTRDQVFQLSDVTDRLNIPVLAYGLRTDFQGEPFEGSKYLLAWSDNLKELKAICDCGRKATMVLRMDADGNAVTEGSQVEIGGNDRYVSMCRKHFKEAFLRLTPVRSAVLADYHRHLAAMQYFPVPAGCACLPASS